MNFYIGNTLKDVNSNSKDAYFTAEFGEFLYQNRKHIKIDLEWLFEINPYDTVFIDSAKIPTIILACKEMIELEVWKDYEYPEDGENAVKDLLTIASEAMNKGKGLISEGD